MLSIEKNNDIKEKLNRALSRLSDLNQTKDVFYGYLNKTNNLQKIYANKIWSSMTDFEERIVKITFYSSDKVKLILNFSKIYRQFSHHWEIISNVNLKNLQSLSNDPIFAEQKIVNQKSRQFNSDLNSYIQQEHNYNSSYQVYEKMCLALSEDITKFRSYSDPIFFYNQKVTTEFLDKLKKTHNKCQVQETKIKTNIQLLDQKRIYLSQSLGQVRQAYVRTFRENLKALYSGINYIIDPSKDQQIKKEDFKLKKQQTEEQKPYTAQIENLLTNVSNHKGNKQEQYDAIKQDFKQLFPISKPNNQISSDQKFLYDRCQNIKNKKLKRSNQILQIQKILINQLKLQIINFKQFDIGFKKNQKKIFKNDGIDSYSKKFRKYFGKNFHQLFQLCVLLAQRPKRSIQKISKTMQNCQQKMQSSFKQKKEHLSFFENRSDIILDHHKKFKQAFSLKTMPSQQIIQEYKKDVLASYQQFSKNYKELETNEQQMDKIFFKSLKQLSDTILKEALNKSLTKILQKQKNRVQIFKQMKIDMQVLTNLKDDVKYQLFFSDPIKPNLNDAFKSLVNNQCFQQTKKILQQKQNTLSGMIKHKPTCCGVKYQPITFKIKESYDIDLVSIKQKQKQIYSGVLNLMQNGINFSQKSFNPFANLIQLIIPNTDIQSYKNENIQQVTFLVIVSKKGPFYFQGKDVAKIHSQMVDIIGIRLQKQSSDHNNRHQTSMTSMLGNSGSQSFRMNFDRSTSSSLNKFQHGGSCPLKNKLKKSRQSVTSSQLLKALGKQILTKNFLSESFILIQKEIPIKDYSRFNYNFKSGHHKFLLKEKKTAQMDRQVLILSYFWKVSFPQNVMLKSFKHYQTVQVELQKTKVNIKITHAVNSKKISLAQKIFYDQITQMNEKMNQFIVAFTERQGDIYIEPQKESELGSEMYIDPQDIIVSTDIPNYRQSKNYDRNSMTGEHFLRGSKIDKSISNFSSKTNNF